jgi:hypothetical protein
VDLSGRKNENAGRNCTFWSFITYNASVAGPLIWCGYQDGEDERAEAVLRFEI